ncbi:hypothetical protein QYF36_013486 [Acer negundo]|nr:hypothetical protein QYF36_013486 [Acer negundo]
MHQHHFLSLRPSRDEWLQALPRALVAGFVKTVIEFQQKGTYCKRGFGGNEPGGFCLSRSVGYTDVGEFIVLVPYVKQVKLSNAVGRLVIASDGICDTLSSDMASQSCRGLPAELVAKLVVKLMSSVGSFF